MSGESAKDWVFSQLLVFLFFLSSFSLVVLFFSPVFSIFFNADDFFILNQIQTKGFVDLLLPIKGVVYYRPLGIQLYFWLTSRLFGLSYLFYHLTSLIFHLLNGILVYLMTKKLTNKQSVALTASFLWLISAVHFLSLGWIVNFSFILGSFFYFLSFLLWLEEKYLFFFLAFLLGLLSSEFLVSLPIVLLVYSFLFKKRINYLIPLFFLIFVYLYLRFFVIQTASGGIYQFFFSPKVLIDNYQWYLLWSFGWAETMRDQLVNLFLLNPKSDFLVNFSREFWIFISGFYLMTATLIFKVGFDLFKGRNLKEYLFSLVWFVVGLLPVAFFSSHAYPHYTSISLFGLVFFVSLLFDKTKKTKEFLLFFLFLVAWIVVSKTTLELNKQAHWLVWHSQLSKKLITESTKNHDTSDYQIIVKGDSYQNSLVLSDQNAMKVIFRNDKIKTVYVQD